MGTCRRRRNPTFSDSGRHFDRCRRFQAFDGTLATATWPLGLQTTPSPHTSALTLFVSNKFHVTIDIVLAKRFSGCSGLILFCKKVSQVTCVQAIFAVCCIGCFHPGCVAIYSSSENQVLEIVECSWHFMKFAFLTK